MIYSNGDNNYAVLVSAEDIVDKYDYDWEVIKKTIVYVIEYNAQYDVCWYLYDGNHPPDGRFGIGISNNQTKDVNDYFNCEIYKKYKVFDVDYGNGRIIEIEKDKSTFCCSDGY